MLAIGMMRSQLSIMRKSYAIALAHPLRRVMTMGYGCAPSATAATARTCYIVRWPHVAVVVLQPMVQLGPRPLERSDMPCLRQPELHCPREVPRTLVSHFVRCARAVSTPSPRPIAQSLRSAFSLWRAHKCRPDAFGISVLKFCVQCYVPATDKSTEVMKWSGW